MGPVAYVSPEEAAWLQSERRRAIHDLRPLLPGAPGTALADVYAWPCLHVNDRNADGTLSASIRFRKGTTLERYIRQLRTPFTSRYSERTVRLRRVPPRGLTG